MRRAISGAVAALLVAGAAGARAGEPGAREWRAAWESLAADARFREASCFSSEQQLAALDGDRIRHRALTRDDFRAPRENRQALRTISLPNAVTQAHVATSLVCIGRLRAEQVAPGRFEVWFEDLEYVALLDREGSWWNPRSRSHPEWVLRHEQLHFDITELVARRHGAAHAEDAARTRFAADTPGAAMRGFAERWSAHMAAVLEECRALQEAYDRETRNGTVPAEQTAWLVRVHRELARLAGPGR